MLDQEIVKEFLISQFDENSPIPQEIDLDKLTADFSEYVEDDYYDWLKDNYKSYFLQYGFIDWNDIQKRLSGSPNDSS